jgi:hypothetical protein
MNKKIEIQPVAPILVRNLVTLAKAYADLTGVKLTTVGTNSTKTASFYIDLQHAPKGRDEPRSCTLKKYDTLTKWFSENWPEGHPTPELEDPTHYRTKPTSATQRSTTRAMPMSADQTAEITRLRRENEQLRYERDTLKKSLAIFAGAPT